MGRHARPSGSNTTKRIALGATVLVGGSVVPVALAGSANAATASEWDVTAQCESSGNWSADTGNGFYGGIQFTQSTWNEFGGQEFASRADGATKAQQITVGERVLWKGYNGNSPQGKGAWPTCGIGLSNTPYDGAVTSTPTPTPPPTPTPTPPPAPADPPDAEDGVYVVKAGDSLSKIATALKVDGGWQKLYEINKKVIGSNPNLIYPGMKLTLPGHEAPPAADPYKDGLPQTGKDSPSAKALQGELQRTGYLAKSVKTSDHYGSLTGTAVAWFHMQHRQFQSEPDPDIQIGPKGWAYLRAAADGSAKGSPIGPSTGQPGSDTGSGTPAPTPPPTPPPTAPPASSGYVSPLGSYTKGDGLIITGGCISRSCGGHSGLDLNAPQGVKVGSVAAGTVVSINSSGSAYGNHVVVKHADGRYTLYAHLSAISVSLGASVSAGQQIGNVGSTGNSSGPHLHFEVRTDPTAFSAGVFLNPVTYLASHGVTI